MSGGTDTVLRYAVLAIGGDWRVVAPEGAFGRFATRGAAFQTAVRLARETRETGRDVEILYTDLGGEVHIVRLAAEMHILNLSRTLPAPPQADVSRPPERPRPFQVWPVDPADEEP